MDAIAFNLFKRKLKLIKHLSCQRTDFSIQPSPVAG